MGRIEKRGNRLHVEHGPKPLQVEKWADQYGVNSALATAAQAAVSTVPFVLEYMAWRDRPEGQASFPDRRSSRDWLRTYRRLVTLLVAL